MTLHDVGALVLVIVMVTWASAAWLTERIEGRPEDGDR